jgi:hypothetical protein
VAGQGARDFATTQLDFLREYRRLVPAGRNPRLALGRVVVPFDGADQATRQRYRAYADSRYQRTRQLQGERGILFAPDLVGPAEEIVARLRADVAVQEVSELRLELPYEFSLADYEQILHDVVHLVAPKLGWRPRTAAAGVPAEAEAS